jgi:hypothetical protein
MFNIFITCIYSVKRSNYEELIVGMIKRGLVLDHSKSPCEENFIPDKKVRHVISGNFNCIKFLILPNILSHKARTESTVTGDNFH